MQALGINNLIHGFLGAWHLMCVCMLNIDEGISSIMFRALIANICSQSCYQLVFYLLSSTFAQLDVNASVFSIGITLIFQASQSTGKQVKLGLQLGKGPA